MYVTWPACCRAAHSLRDDKMPLHLIDLYNFKPPADLMVNREESQAIRLNAAKTSLVRAAGRRRWTALPVTPHSCAEGSQPGRRMLRADHLLRCCCFFLQEFRRNAFNTDSVDEALDLLNFCYKIVERSGLSAEGTYLPKAIHPKVCVSTGGMCAAYLCCRQHRWSAAVAHTARVLGSPFPAVQLCDAQDQHR